MRYAIPETRFGSGTSRYVHCNTNSVFDQSHTDISLNIIYRKLTALILVPQNAPGRDSFRKTEIVQGIKNHSIIES